MVTSGRLGVSAGGRSSIRFSRGVQAIVMPKKTLEVQVTTLDAVLEFSIDVSAIGSRYAQSIRTMQVV